MSTAGGSASAVWRAARAAVRRRKLQTAVIGLVVFLSTATIVVALALLVASSAPFDRAFAQQRGAHMVATFDPERITNAQLARTAEQPAVEALAGPFDLAVLEADVSGEIRGQGDGPLTVVGRADPAGPVDRVDLWKGRWATGPDEIVLNLDPPKPGYSSWFALGGEVTVAGGPSLTVVGFAYSLSQTADAWVSPDQLEALGPTATQVLYRFTDAGTSAQIEAGLDAATTELPPDSLLASQSYLVIKEAVAAGPGVYVPFLMVFGVLGLVVAVLIVVNVVSGAVVSGFRHIGVLKALGFTPRQVVAVYLTMIAVPAVVGCVLGTILGDLAARPLLSNAFQGLGLGEVGVSPWVDAAALLGMPAMIVLAALVPAWRARRLSAAAAISAGSAPRRGRGLRVQRWLSGTKLPRPVSLGLGLPFARPARAGLTMAAVVLGVVTVTFATGLASSLTRYAEATAGNDAVGVRSYAVERGETPSTRSDPQIEALLRSLPGTVHVTAGLGLRIAIVGYTQPVDVSFLRGDSDTLGYQDQLVAGRWLRRPGELVAPSALLHERGLAVGDRITLELGDRRTSVTVVGETMAGGPGPSEAFLTHWQALTQLAPDHHFENHEVLYQVEVAPGTDIPAYLASVSAADPGLDAWDNRGTDEVTGTVIGFSSILTLMLSTVAALGVFNTVVLNTRERRRDLGMLKSIGMTPRQVVVMVVTSMAALGAAGGLLAIPLGMVAHRLIVPMAADAARVTIPHSLLTVWQPALLGLLAVAGVAIAVLGALLPARAAARLTIAEVLHSE